MSLAEIPANDTPESGPRKAPISFSLGSDVELAHACIASLGSDAEAVYDQGEIHTYDKLTGTYSPTDRATLSRTIQTFDGFPVATLDGKPLRLRKSNVYGAIDLAYDKCALREFFAKAPVGIAFLDGFLRMGPGGVVLDQHSPKNRARHAFGFAYDPKASRARWLACLGDAFLGDGDANEKIAVIQEYMGAALFGFVTRFTTVLAFIGERGGNAKSTIAKVMLAAFPPGSTVALPPHEWSNDYSRGMFAGKRMNFVAEMPEADILDSGPFKNIVDPDRPIKARNPYERPFELMPTCGHLFLLNKLMGTNDQTGGFFRRWILVQFSRTFTDPGVRNINMATEIIRDELPGVVAWLVDGAVRAWKRQRLTVPPSSDDLIAGWRRDSNPVQAFVEEKTRPAQHDNERESSAVLFAAFVEFCEKNKNKVPTHTTFSKRMANLGLGSEHTRIGKVFPVSLLRPGEENPRDIERAMVAEAERERRAGAAIEADPADAHGNEAPLVH